MRFPTLLLLLLLLLCLTTLTLAQNSEKYCRINRPKAYQAIGNFCKRSGRLIVPSEYARVGQRDATGRARAWITGNCSGGQWVPQRFCRAQFMEMCQFRTLNKKFGTRMCQYWHLRFDPQSKIGEEPLGGFHKIRKPS
ncbi:unnamed protein product [Zymoseptoria tritici ST99CH_3D1]|uniref:Cyanovirin-N domain-containing protein n=1 Tax=Zymoseptoria tritici (strain ST99CH_3D7) TaxID=1276538 RepID=A0A1X7RYF2_ZYMT9|nr:unnamed protein product [Zymoseptoria tritici ST99CH_3D7]SMR57497.1 unnamed protein product [Zymoseptoria tritici ST99CH_3D1]